MYVQCRYPTNNPHHVVLENKISKISQISFKFRAITNLSCVPLNPWLIPRINIQKSNLYCNGFIVKKLIYWSEHTHNRPGWRPKSYKAEIIDVSGDIHNGPSYYRNKQPQQYQNVWGESDVPACGPLASFSVHLASSAVTPAGSVHKSRGDNVVRMWVQLKR